jgi:ADP-ribose pyrophosphatase
MKEKIPDHAERVFKGVLFDIYQWQQEMFDGSFATFEAIKRNTSVTIIPTTRSGNLLINYEEQPYKGKFISLPGGQSEDKEDLLECAKRELLEETGCVAESWQTWILSDVLKTSKIDWYNQFYFARNCKKVAELDLDAGERIETKEVSFEEFIDFTQRDEFRNSEIRNLVQTMIDSRDKLEEFRKEIFGE